MQAQPRRRSTRLRKLNEASTKPVAKPATTKAAQGRRCDLSTRPNATTTNKRKKPGNQISLQMPTMERRMTRSMTRDKQMLLPKSVTPSPTTTGGPKFTFSSPLSRKQSKVLPKGAIDLYKDGTSTPDYASRWKFLARWETGKATDVALSIDYLRKYGEEYSSFLRETERPLLDAPSSPKPSPSDHSSQENSSQSTFSSPRSSSSSSRGLFQKTPCKEKAKDRWVATSFHRIPQKQEFEPIQDKAYGNPMSDQPALTPKMRAILVDWMIELSEHFRFGSDTLHLAITLVDRVLARGKFWEGDDDDEDEDDLDDFEYYEKKKKTRVKKRRLIEYDSEEDVTWEYDEEFLNFPGNWYSEDEEDSDVDDYDYDLKDDATRCWKIPRDRFQLLGAACVWVACKIQEKVQPKASEIAYVADHIYTLDQITRMERRVCNALEFAFFQVPTPHQFVFEFVRASLADTREGLPACEIGTSHASHSVFKDMVDYLLELGRLSWGPTQKNPSLLTAAAVYLARITLGMGDWTPTLEHYTGYSKEDLKETVLEIHDFQMASEASSLKSTFHKFKAVKYHKVALKTIVPVNDLGFGV